MKVFSLAAKIMLLSSLSVVSLAKPDGNPDKSDKSSLNLEKESARESVLPLNWEQKVVAGERLDDDFFAHGIVLSAVDVDHVVRMKIERKIFHIDTITREILDVLH
ncbi:hypothetical protein [Aurantivibrio plasticivorans]